MEEKNKLNQVAPTNVVNHFDGCFEKRVIELNELTACANSFDEKLL